MEFCADFRPWCDTIEGEKATYIEYIHYLVFPVILEVKLIYTLLFYAVCYVVLS